MALGAAKLFAVVGVPDAEGLVAAAGGDEFAIGAEQGKSDRGVVIAECEQDLAALALPDLGRLVSAGRNDAVAIRAEGSVPYGAVMTFEVARLQDDVEVPQADDEIAGAGSKLGALDI